MRKLFQLFVPFFIFAALCFFAAGPASAQGSFFTLTAQRYTPAGIFAASGATVTICTASGTGTPCTPTISLFKDSALSQPVSNPLPVCGTPPPQFGCVDGLGNASFYAATTGPYTYTITGAGLTAYGPIPISAVSSGSLSAPNAWTALQTFNAGITSAGPNTLKGVNTVGQWNGNCIVDGTQNATLAGAVTCAGSSGVIEIAMFAVPALTASVTIPAGVTLRFDGPSGITTTGFTLTINGPLQAPTTQIFFGTGTVAFGRIAAQSIYPDWFPGADYGAQMNAAFAALPSCSPVPSVGFGVSPVAPCGTIQLPVNASGYTLSTGVTINGLMTRIVGSGKTATTLNCSAAACFTFNNQSPYAFAPTMSVEGGLYGLTLNGNGSASQIGVFCKTCDGMIARDVRFSNFNGTSANAFEFLNDATGGITERNDWIDVAFDNDTNGLLMTTSGATNSTSFGHNFFRHLQWSLANGQTAWTLGGSGTNGGAAFYSSFVDAEINPACNPCTGLTGTAFSISGTAVVRTGPFSVSTDVGVVFSLTFCSGCTTTNFQIWGEQAGVPGWFAAKNSPIILDVTAPLVGNTLQFQLNEVAKMQATLDGSNGVQWLNASNNPVFGMSQTGVENQLGLQLFNTTTTCTTTTPNRIRRSQLR